MDNSKYIFNYYEEKKKIFQGENNKNEDVLSAFFKIPTENTTSTHLNHNNNNNNNTKSKPIYQQYIFKSLNFCYSQHFRFLLLSFQLLLRTFYDWYIIFNWKSILQLIQGIFL